MKKCTQCEIQKPLEEFSKRKASKDGLAGQCKECAKAYCEANKEKIAARDKAYRKLNKEKRAATRKVYCQANREKINATHKAYIQKNKEKRKAQKRARYQANKEKICESKKAYYQDNKEKKAAYNKAYLRAKPEVSRSRYYRRRAQKQGLSSESFLDIEIFDRDGWKCGICGKKVNKKLKYPNPKSVSLDHIVPLSKGGGHIRNNVQCSHLRCNICKSANMIGQLLLEMF